MSWDALDAAWDKLRKTPQKHHGSYLGFYSSWLGGFFREPFAMFVPLDDHGFHRGDGVFEAARIVKRAYIDFAPHLERLEASAEAIGLKLPKSREEIGEICLELGRRASSENALEDGVLRLYVTRGPGGFGPAPGESVGAQIFAAITTIKPPARELYQRGVRACVTEIPAKPAPWSRIKSLNYLQNVMMKRETLARGFDYGLSVDQDGRVCEGATENFAILSRERELLVPKFDYTLRGTTVRSAMKIAERWVAEGRLRGVRLTDLTLTDVRAASESAFVGTTIGVLPIASLDAHTYASTETMSALQEALQGALSIDTDIRTPF